MSGKGEGGSGNAGGGDDDGENAKARARREREEASAAAGGGYVKPGAQSVSNAANKYGTGRLADVKLRSAQELSVGARAGAGAGAGAVPAASGLGRTKTPPRTGTKSSGAAAAAAAAAAPSSRPGAHYGEGRLADIKSADAAGVKTRFPAGRAVVASTAHGRSAASKASQGSADAFPNEATAGMIRGVGDAVEMGEDADQEQGTLSSTSRSDARPPDLVAATDSMITGGVEYEPGARVATTALSDSLKTAGSDQPRVIRGEVGYDAEDGQPATEEDGFEYSVAAAAAAAAATTDSAGVQPMGHDDPQPPRRDSRETYPPYEAARGDSIPNIIDGPAVARPVLPEEIDQEAEEFEDIPTATGYEPKAAVPFRKTKRCRVFAVAGVCLIIAAVVGAVVGTTVGGSGGGGTTARPTPEPTAAPTPAYYLQTVGEYLTDQFGEKVNEPGTPYNSALVWIDEVDPMGLTTQDDNLIRRYLLAVHYYSTVGDGGEGSGWARCGATDPPSSGDDACETIHDDNGELINPSPSVRWLSGVDECQWMGVECAGEQIVDLVIVQNNLQGTLVPELYGITTLQGMRFRGNALTGTIPAEYGLMSSMLLMNLNANQLTGMLPLTDLYNIGTLQELKVYNNSLTGTIPAPPAGSWPRMEQLALGMNRFSGEIPGELGGLPRLVELDFFNNTFSGPIPPGLGSASNLARLFLDLNDLTGAMPEEVCDLRSGSLRRLEVDCAEVKCSHDCCTNCS